MNEVPNLLFATYLKKYINALEIVLVKCFTFQAEVKLSPCETHETSPGQGIPPLVLYPAKKSHATQP